MGGLLHSFYVAALGGIARPKDGFAYSCPDLEESSFLLTCMDLVNVIALRKPNTLSPFQLLPLCLRIRDFFHRRQQLC